MPLLSTMQGRIFKDPSAHPVDQKGSCAGGRDVGQMPPDIAKLKGDLAEDGLLGGEGAVDVEEVGVVGGIDGHLHKGIDRAGDQAAGQVQGEDLEEPTAA